MCVDGKHICPHSAGDLSILAQGNTIHPIPPLILEPSWFPLGNVFSLALRLVNPPRCIVFNPFYAFAFSKHIHSHYQRGYNLSIQRCKCLAPYKGLIRKQKQIALTHRHHDTLSYIWTQEIISSGDCKLYIINIHCLGVVWFMCTYCRIIFPSPPAPVSHEPFPLKVNRKSRICKSINWQMLLWRSVRLESHLQFLMQFFWGPKTEVDPAGSRSISPSLLHLRRQVWFQPYRFRSCFGTPPYFH